MADHNKTTVGELTGTRRRFSVIHLPKPIAEFFGMDEVDAKIRIEHGDEGLSAAEIPYIRALWELKNKEAKRGGR